MTGTDIALVIFWIAVPLVGGVVIYKIWMRDFKKRAR